MFFIPFAVSEILPRRPTDLLAGFRNRGRWCVSEWKWRIPVPPPSFTDSTVLENRRPTVASSITGTMAALSGEVATAWPASAHGAPGVTVTGMSARLQHGSSHVARAEPLKDSRFRVGCTTAIGERVRPETGKIMANVVIVGAQWGDEGKGKIVDWLGERSDIVARFQGGHNAGHTLVIGGEVYKLNALPSGVVREGTLSVIGSGAVLDPWHLIREIEAILAQGVKITPETLMIAENTPLILPFHGELDRAREARNPTARIGTTGRGIGPCYEDKAGRRAIRVADLADGPTLEQRIGRALVHHDALRAGLGLGPVDRNKLLEGLREIAPEILRYAGPVWKVIDERCRAGKRILFEGAQGALLDMDFGTYPYVTSSNTIAGQAATGVGTGPGAVDFVLGVAKAYTTRVGEGPFPTELVGADGHRLGERGQEFGTVTGRKRRCGWFDAVLVRQARATSGIDGIALTKLDVLDGFAELKICVAYEIDGERLDYLPAAAGRQARCRPVYETLQGWQDSTGGVRDLAGLPEAARTYVRRIEELTGCPTALVSTGPEREDTILVTDPFADR